MVCSCRIFWKILRVHFKIFVTVLKIVSLCSGPSKCSKTHLLSPKSNGVQIQHLDKLFARHLLPPLGGVSEQTESHSNRKVTSPPCSREPRSTVTIPMNPQPSSPTCARQRPCNLHSLYKGDSQESSMLESLNSLNPRALRVPDNDPATFTLYIKGTYNSPQC